jgi:hypothetical protein
MLPLILLLRPTLAASWPLSCLLQAEPLLSACLQVPAGAKMVAEAAFERRFSQRPQSASQPARIA